MDEGVMRLGLNGNGADIADLPTNSKPRRSGLGVGGVLYWLKRLYKYNLQTLKSVDN